MHLVIDAEDALVRLGSSKAYADIARKADQESGKQFVDREPSADRGDHELPDDDHGRACDHTGDRALLVGSSPEECQEHLRSESCAESCPGERYDTEYRAVGIPRKDYCYCCDSKNSQPCRSHLLAVAELDAEEVLCQVLGHTRCGREKLGVSS